MALQLAWSDMLRCDAHSVSLKVERRGGVYKLLSRRKSKKFEPFYVGEADDLQEVLLNHLKSGESNKCIRDTLRTGDCKFRFAYLESAESRRGAELFMLHHYKGLCNETMPDGEPLDINVA